jgi:hypothetical protein
MLGILGVLGPKKPMATPATRPEPNVPEPGTPEKVACILQFVMGVRVSLAFGNPKT